MGILTSRWHELVDAIEADFKAGSITDDEVKLRLHTVFDYETAELMWSCLYSARKYNSWS